MALSDLPTPQSQVQILGTMLDVLASKTGIAKLKVGNPLLSLLETTSLTQSKSTYDVLKALKAKDLDNTTGIALQSIGNDEKLPQLGPQYARTTVNITDSSFTKIGSNISHAGVAPIAGSLSVNVDKTPTFEGAASTGTVYIGRGTTQSEGPLSYTDKTDNGSYWTLTLSSPTSVFHNLGEEVVVGQGGDRPVNAGQAVFTAPGVLSSPIQYTVTVAGSIPDGEVELLNIPVVCTSLGTIGNVPENTITDFGGSPPFSGAAVTNPSRVTSGWDTETTKQYRDRIKAKRNTKISGTDLAIVTAAKGVSSSDESKTVLSSSLLRRLGKPSLLTIDDGNGYQPIWEGASYEVLRSISTGGEKDFKVLNTPIVLASVETLNTAPFPIANGTTLKVAIGSGSEEIHTFNTAVFNDPSNGSSYDLVSSINNNSLLSFTAKVTSNSSKMTLYPKNEAESIQVTGGTANEILGFSTSKSYTALLYKNDRYLTTSNSDYVIDRATGDLTLSTELTAGDTLTMGSLWSRGFVESAAIDTITLNDDVTLWAAIDNNTEIIDSGKGIVSTLTVAFDKATPSSFHATVQNSVAFDSAVQAGDSLLLYTTGTNNLPSALSGVWKIISKPASDTVVIELPQMRSARKLAAAANFPAASKKVLICGGLCGQTGGLLNTAEIYDTVTGEFTQATSMTYARYGHTATLLNNGNILVVGGFGTDGEPVKHSELYDTSAGTWSAAAFYNNAAFRAAAILLASGNVLVTGGIQTGNSVCASSATYSVGTDSWAAEADFEMPRYGHTLIMTDTDDVFMLGGLTSATSNKSCTYTCNMYSYAGDTWSTKTAIPIVSTITSNRNAVGELYNNGAIVSVIDNVYYTYDVATDAWTLVGDIATVAGISDVTIYGGTSVKALDPEYFSAGFANPIVKSSTGILTLMFAEYTNSITGKRKPVHLVYNTGTGNWDVTDTSNVSGCRSMYAAVPLNGAGHTNEVATFGGQATDLYYSGGEEVINATQEVFNTSTKALSYLSPLFTTFPGEQGWCIFRHDYHVSQCVIPDGENYTSQTLAPLIDFDGAFASTYQTNKIRVSTDDHNGDFTLLGPTVATIENEVPYTSGVSLFASSKSVRSEKDIPYDFEVFSVGAVSGDLAICPLTYDVFESNDVNPVPPLNTPKMAEMPLNGVLCGLSKKNYLDGDIDYAVNIAEYGNFKNQIARIGSWSPSGAVAVDTDTLYSTITLGTDFAVPVIPNQPFYCGTVCLFTKEESLSVTIDNDQTSGLFTIPMHRKVKPVGTTYGSQVTICDADNSDLELAKSFGLDYEFENFGVLMRARTKVDNILYRFYRFGAEGENYVVRYQYPSTPSAATKVSTTYEYLDEPNIYAYQRQSFIDIYLPSGTAYTNSAINPTSQLSITQASTIKGVSDMHILSGLKVASYERTSIGGTTTLTVEFPDEAIMLDMLATNVFTVGQFIRFDAVTSTPTTLQSGQTQITNVSNRSGVNLDLTIAAGSLDDGTAALAFTEDPGTISFDPTAQAEVTFNASIAAGDIVVLKSPLHFADNPMRVIATGDTYQWLHCVALDLGTEIDTSYLDTINSADNISIFGKPTSTQASLITDINALFNAGNSPISATSIGTNTAAVEKASWDTSSDWEAGYPLVDGYNAVLATIKPATIENDTQITFKKAVSGDLATSSDWANEILYLVPQYAKDIVKWFNTPCVTGLWSKAEAKTADGGTSVQISSLTPGSSGSVQVSGIGANSTAASIINTIYTNSSLSYYPWSVVTIRSSDASYFSGNSWVKVTNARTLPKTLLTSGNVNSINSDGTVTLSANPYQTRGDRISCTATIEPAGDFVVVKLGTSMSDISVTDGDFLHIEDPITVSFTTNLEYISDVNKGTFRIIRHSHNNSVFWIENPNAVFEKCTLSAIVVSYNSVVPGDQVIISDDVFGIGNKGTWDITAVGASTPTSPMFDDATITLSIADKTPQALNAVTAFTNSSLQFTEGTPAVLYKKILGISLNADDYDLTDIKFLGKDIGLISAATGSVMTALNKLEFSSGINIGVDAYKYHTGLIQEVNKVLYGDSSDTQTYPGVVSNGASVLIDGPVIKRVKVTFAVRINGNPSKDLADRIKSMIAGVINSSPHGQNIAVSALTTASDTVDGVISTTPVNLSDQIIVNAQEKAMILNLDDVSIIFVGQ